MSFEKPGVSAELKGNEMANYSKLFGSIIGGLVGLGVSIGLLEEPSPELVGAITTTLAALFTYFFPANKPS